MDMKWISKHDPVQETAAKQWEQGLPLGNGKIGAMVWGGEEEKPLNISVDQAEIWELRAYEPPKDKSWTEYKELLRQNRGTEVEGFERDPEKTYSTRFPIGRIELYADEKIVSHVSRLSLYNARCEGCLKTDNGEIPYAVWTSAGRQIMIVEYKKGALHPKWKFIFREGDYSVKDCKESSAYNRLQDEHIRLTDLVRKWKYPEFAEHMEGELKCYSQDLPESGGFSVVTAELESYMLISVQWSKESAIAAEKNAIAAVKEGIDAGLETLKREHEEWWNHYYQASCISIPDTRLEGYYYLQIYMLACSTRPDGIHMTLCGPWTDDNNLLPICSNDYHWNLEQEMQLWPVYASNRVEFGDPMLDMIEDHMDTLKEMSKFHFKVDGAFLAHSTDCYLRPTYMNVDNYELNGLPWVCMHYWRRYLYTMDEEFLKMRAYPVMKLAIAPVLAEMTMGEDGKLHLPWTSSPEYHGENETRRWLFREHPDWSARFGPDATIDLSLTKWLLETLCKVSEMLDCDSELRSIWQDTLDKLAPYPLDDFGALAVRADVFLKTTHRHMSHLFPIYPIGEMTMDTHEELIDRCLDVIGINGRGEWVGWTFPWISIIYTRARRSSAARNLLLDYIDRYVTETGMHYQGPQGGCDVSLYGKKDGLFGLTIEAQLGVPEAIHEMLMHSENNVVRIFKDAPPAWANCSFKKLRSEGAFLIDAKRSDYHTEYVRIYSEKGGQICIDTDLGEGTLHGAAIYENGLYTINMKAGETVELYRGDEPEFSFVPENGYKHEEHFWGVKKIRRF